MTGFFLVDNQLLINVFHFDYFFSQNIISIQIQTLIPCIFILYWCGISHIDIPPSKYQNHSHIGLFIFSNEWSISKMILNKKNLWLYKYHQNTWWWLENVEEIRKIQKKAIIFDSWSSSSIIIILTRIINSKKSHYIYPFTM